MVDKIEEKIKEKACFIRTEYSKEGKDELAKVTTSFP
jgi:hypothetical protein